MALDLGDDWNQKKISLLEQKEIIEDPLLKIISEVLKIPVEAFQNFDEEQAVNIIFNIVNVNPIEEIKKLHEEKMLKEKMMVSLEKLIEKK